MALLSLLLARPLTENPTGTELGGGYSSSSQGTALFFWDIYFMLLCAIFLWDRLLQWEGKTMAVRGYAKRVGAEEGSSSQWGEVPKLALGLG